MKAVIFTLGCKVNNCESLALSNGLQQLGYTVETNLVTADLYIINTCAVTAEAEKKSRQVVAKARKLSQTAKIIVTGCASQNSPQDFMDRHGVTLVTGTKCKDKILSMLEVHGIELAEDNNYYEEYLPSKTSYTRAFIKVQDGCNNFCSYCIIPYLRGRSRSRSIENIIKEIEYLNPLECVITGINLSAYHFEGNKLPNLMTALSNINCRIRLGSLEVNVITHEFLQALKGLKQFAPHFHLSLQSGNDSVLKSMNRHYTMQEYLEKVNLIRNYFPLSAITTDIIAGYSTETDEQFEQSLPLIKQANFADIHPFPYSKRQGTVGAKLKELPAETKANRMHKLTQIKADCKKAFCQANLGTTHTFVPEYFNGTHTLGYTDNYIWTYIEGQLPLKITTVCIENLYSDGVIAKQIAD